MNSISKNSTRQARCRGMTLVEMMFSVTISVVVVGLSMAFLIEATRTTMRVRSNTENDLTEWGIYAGITIDTRTANGMTLYKDFAASSFSDASKQITSNATRGDFMVLSQSIQEDNSNTPTYQILTGYLFTPVSAGKGTLKKFVYTVTAAEKNNTLESILTARRSQFVFRTVATGLDATSTDSDPTTPQNRAFLYRSTKLRSGVMNLEMSTGSSSLKTANKKLVETAFYIRR